MRMEIDYEEEKQRKNNILSIAVGDFCPDAVSFFLDGPERLYDKQRDNDSTDPVAGFSRMRFMGKNLWFALLLSTMMIPQTVLMIPQFLIWQAVGAYNTFIPLTLPCFFGSAFHVFLVRQFYAGIPKEYDEAALVDGANYLTIYAKIIVPMAKPVLCTVAVFTFMNTWNDFMGPLLYLDKENLKTVSLALQNFMGQHRSEWNLLMALSSVITLPMIVVYFMAQRYFIEGITFSGLKG